MNVMSNDAAPVTFYKAPPEGTGDWHRQWVKGQIAGEVRVPCDGCAAPCCTSFEYITVDPRVDEVSQYATRRLASGRLVLQQHDDGACIYFVDGRCSIHDHRPATCRVFDCRIYDRLIPKWMDMVGWSGPARDCADQLYRTTKARFRLVEKEAGDHTFDQRFWAVFLPLLKDHPDWDLTSALGGALIRMTDARTQRRYAASRVRREAHGSKDKREERPARRSQRSK